MVDSDSDDSETHEPVIRKPLSLALCKCMKMPIYIRQYLFLKYILRNVSLYYKVDNPHTGSFLLELTIYFVVTFYNKISLN